MSCIRIFKCYFLSLTQTSCYGLSFINFHAPECAKKNGITQGKVMYQIITSLITNLTMVQLGNVKDN